jgi:hypothetical protein
MGRSKYAFPHLSLARRISINLEEGNRWLNRSFRVNHGLCQMLDFMCRAMAVKGTLLAHVGRDRDFEMRLRLDGDTKFEETRIRELRQRGWKVEVEEEKDVSILKGFGAESS